MGAKLMMGSDGKAYKALVTTEKQEMPDMDQQGTQICLRKPIRR